MMLILLTGIKEIELMKGKEGFVPVPNKDIINGTLLSFILTLDVWILEYLKVLLLRGGKKITKLFLTNRSA